MANAPTGRPLQWTPIAEKFPATLNTVTDPELLADGQTPAAYGMGIDVPGRLYAGAIYAGTARATATTQTEPTNHPADSVSWYYWFGRLWGVSGSSVIYYGAQGYVSTFIRDGTGMIEVDDDTGGIITAIPFGDSVCVLKAAAAYVIPGAADKGGGFNWSHVVQGFGVAVAANATELDGTVYANRADGVFAFDGNQIVEITRPVRGYANMVSVALLADYTKKRIIGTSKFIIDCADNNNFYDYSTAGFLWTSRTLTDRKETRPITVRTLGFALEFSDTTIGTITWQIQTDGGAWSAARTETIRYSNADDRAWYETQLTDAVTCTRFAMRITALSANMRIKRVMMYSSLAGSESYRT